MVWLWFLRVSRLGIAPEIHADEPSIRTASNYLPFLPCHEAPPGGNQAHNSHTREADHQVLLGFNGVSLIRFIQCLAKRNDSPTLSQLSLSSSTGSFKQRFSHGVQATWCAS